MRNLILKYLLFPTLFVAVLGCNAQKLTENERLVVEYTNARNSYDMEKIKALVAENYNEIDFDGDVALENREQLIENALWGKELSSQAEILEIKTVANTVVTKATYSSYMDEVLERKPRTLLVTHTIENGKLLSEKIDTSSCFRPARRMTMISGRSIGHRGRHSFPFILLGTIPLSYKTTAVYGRLRYVTVHFWKSGR